MGDQQSKPEAILQEVARIENPTFGQKAVGINFNPSNLGPVDRVKQHYANVIDGLNDLRNSVEATPEVKRLCSIAITEAQGAQMWAVKAITWKD